MHRKTHKIMLISVPAKTHNNAVTLQKSFAQLVRESAVTFTAWGQEGSGSAAPAAAFGSFSCVRPLVFRNIFDTEILPFGEA